MKLGEIIKELDLNVSVDGKNFDKEVSTCYVSDLLSNVMGQAVDGSVWVTMQGHQNIVAIASLLSIPAIIVTGSSAIETETLKKSQDNDITILSTPMTTFETAGKLYQAGLRGSSK